MTPEERYRQIEYALARLAELVERCARENRQTNQNVSELTGAIRMLVNSLYDFPPGR